MHDRHNQDYLGSQGDAAPHSSDESALQRVHRVLKGRYVLLVVMVLALGGGGAYLGWTSKAPLYRSARIIEATPTLDGGGRPMPHFGNYVATQVSLLQSSRLMDRALTEAQWLATGLGSTDAARERFEDGLTVESVPGTWTISVMFVDSNPAVAKAGVDSLVRAFERYTDETDTREERADKLEAEVTKLRDEIKAASDQIDAVSTKYGGVGGLSAEISRVNESHIKTEELLAQAEDELKAFGELGKEPTRGDVDPYEAKSQEHIAVEEADLRGLLQNLTLARMRLRHLDGRGPKDPQLRAAKDEVESLKIQIEQFVEAWNTAREEAEEKAREARFELEKRRYEERKRELHLLESRQKRLKKRLDELGGSRSSLGADLATALRHQRDIEYKRGELESKRGRLREAKLEAEGSGHLTFPDVDKIPATARQFKDPRKTFSAALGLLGALIGAGIVLLLALRDRRLRGATDVQHSLRSVRMLGFLPLLPRDRGSSADGEIAAHSAHQIRTILQVRHARQPNACLCITGPNAACGKTTVTKALGLSYASSGARTLIIDADFTGRGLSRTVAHMLLGSLRDVAHGAGANADEVTSSTTTVLAPLVQDPPVGLPLDPEEVLSQFEEILRSEGLLSAFDSGSVESAFALADLVGGSLRSKLSTALDAAKRAQSSNGSLSWASAPAQRAPLDPDNLNGSMPSVEQLVYRTGSRNLRFLPLGGLGRAGSVSAASIQRVLERVRTEFDVVLIDTGPIRGSVETSMVAAYADSVVLVVSPGDDRETAERAVEHLNDIEARIAGVVLNRANAREIEASTSFSIVRSRNQEL